MTDKGFIFDLDGTIYIDNSIIDGAIDAIDSLRKNNHQILFVTNKSISTREEYKEKLERLGIPATLSEIINSNFIVAKYLKERLSEDETVLVIGEQPLIDELKMEKIGLTDDPEAASYVVLGWDRQFTYDKINLAYQAWKRGAKIIATNPDRTCPVEEGDIPDCASMIGAIEATTGQEIEAVIGKPSKYLSDYLVNNILQLPPDQCYIVGDRLETDILMGNQSGINSVLVLTGISTADDVAESEIKPDYVLKNVGEISGMLQTL